MTDAWNNFKRGQWQERIDVRDFIQNNYHPYLGDATFLADASGRTNALWQECTRLLKAERDNNGVLTVDPTTVSTITSHQPGYIRTELECIVGLQTDAALKRGAIVNGGVRMAEQACTAYGCTLNPEISRTYREDVTTHNSAVFGTYTEEMKKARKLGIITGLPDGYGRGRIIGDYRRVALYGVDRLIAAKQNDLNNLAKKTMDQATIGLREELNSQIKALLAMAVMADSYGFDIRRPAENASEAVQWLYFAYLAAIKEQNGAAMSLGRISGFLDIYIERDLQNGLLDESGAQELLDQLVIKLRLARHLRTPDYNELFAGDPMWITESLGGTGLDGRTLVTKTAFRMLHTLYTLGPAPEPNLTILWSENLPDGFKKFCAKTSLDTSSIQYENDDIMRPLYGDDYGIACCVSAMRLGQQMQFFGARANLAKALLLAINGGRDEKTGEQLGPELPLPSGETLDYAEVRRNLSTVLDWLAGLYVNTLNIIHYMHDKYAYESAQMALHDSNVARTMAFGIAGLSVTADSLSALLHGQVRAVRDERGIATGFCGAGEFPCFGNDDDRVDRLAVELTEEFIAKLRQHPTYRQAEHTLSVLTITSNVMYGKKTGATPDGRNSGQPFAPGANPMHGRDKNGALAALHSLSKLSYDTCRDGISYTFSILPATLGKTDAARQNNLVGLLDGYAKQGGHHININVLDRSILEAARRQPEDYPQLTIRVSGYAVHFIKLTAAQQSEVIERTFYEAL
ncbi:formate C-acetyltransferase [Azotosporobacter soli]|uniref:formate C-acetyltransferase n=1 Tax=Azotosporobacter soli TaxID=3055040 RepID=UPI0031FECF78